MRALGGVVAVIAAVGVVLLAVDVGRVRESLEANDARYRLTPFSARDEARTILPEAFASRLLDVEDDLAYRRALQRLAALHARERSSTSRNYAVLVTEAQRGLIEISQTDSDPRRRSEATNVLGVFAVADPSSYSGFNPEFPAGIRIFQNAVRIDPSNQEAKRNLEIALRGLRRVLLPIEPRGQRGAPNEGTGAGIGRTGGGY
jgi:hypothetical protein